MKGHNRMPETFEAMIQRQWGYLVSEFGFSLPQLNADGDPFVFSAVEFRSRTTVVEIIIDRARLSVLLGPSTEPEVARLNVRTILEYFGHEDAKAMLAPEEDLDDLVMRITSQMARHASAVRKFCEPMLRGDFSRWLEICQYFETESGNWFRSHVGREPPQGQFSRWLRSKKER